MKKPRGFLMKPHTLKVTQTVKRLIKQGEKIYGKSDSVGHKVQEYVQDNMVRLGMRIKVNPRKFAEPLPLKGEQYYIELYDKYFGDGNYERSRDEI